MSYLTEEYYAKRNAEIYAKKCAKIRIKNLAIEYDLTESGIKQILAKVRKQLSAMVIKT